jgi:hypothetical protein
MLGSTAELFSIQVRDALALHRAVAKMPSLMSTPLRRSIVVPVFCAVGFVAEWVADAGQSLAGLVIMMLGFVAARRSIP